MPPFQPFFFVHVQRLGLQMQDGLLGQGERQKKCLFIPFQGRPSLPLDCSRDSYQGIAMNKQIRGSKNDKGDTGDCNPPQNVRENLVFDLDDSMGSRYRRETNSR